MIFRTLDEVEQWVVERGGVEGGGLDALEAALSARRFGGKSLRLALEFRQRHLHLRRASAATAAVEAPQGAGREPARGSKAGLVILGVAALTAVAWAVLRPMGR